MGSLVPNGWAPCGEGEGLALCLPLRLVLTSSTSTNTVTVFRVGHGTAADHKCEEDLLRAWDASLPRAAEDFGRPFSGGGNSASAGGRPRAPCPRGPHTWPCSRHGPWHSLPFLHLWRRG